MIVHAGLLAIREAQFWRGVLITGASGVGKSDLALRCLDHGFRLVADDRVLLWACDGRVYGRAPDPLTELIEVRGLGVWPESALPYSEIRLVAAYSPIAEIDRAPAPGASEILLNTPVARIDLDFSQDSAPAKLRRALLHLG